MVAIPKKITTESLLDEKSEVSYGRPYLGMSGLGSDCMRSLWYGFHWCSKKEISARTNRIFRDGHNAEATIISDLKAIGYEVFRLLPDGSEVEMTGALDEEQEEMIGAAGHVKGHNDGRVRGVVEAPKTVHLLEMKTANDKRFKEMKTKGIQQSDPTYYSQCQMYMGELALTRTLFIAKNKNDGSYYVERIKFDQEHYDMLKAKAWSIITSDAPPKKEFSPTWFKCKYCSHYDMCHFGKEPEKNCRTCDYSDIEDNGKWSCQKNKKDLSVEDQQKGCKSYKKGWGL